MIHLKSITWDNFWDVIKISPKDSQQQYVKPVSLFMAQSYVNLKENYQDVSLAIYDDEVLIGFTKIVYVPKDVKPYELITNAYMIDAIIINEGQQGKGYGKKSMDKILDYCKLYPFNPVVTIALICYEENKQAQSLFASLGFKRVKQTNKIKKMSLYSRHL